MWYNHHMDKHGWVGKCLVCFTLHLILHRYVSFFDFGPFLVYMLIASRIYKNKSFVKVNSEKN